MAAYGEPSLVLQEDNFEPREKWKKIGEGGFSKVYKAYCYKHNGDVAAKEVTRGDQLKEIQKLVKLSTHIHVVGIKGVYRDHDSNFIIMEYCSYSLSELRKTLGKTYIPWPRCLHFMQQILSGVEFLHHNNIIHRDIKPENVMVTDSFVCKIADFGLSKDQASYTNSKITSGNFNKPSGTMFYNSPERWKSPADPAKESDDIYSCAMVFYKMITNADLFCMETRAQDESVLKDLRYYLVNLEYRHDLQNVGRGSPDTVPEIVITVIEGCWHVNPTERKTVQHWTELLRDYNKKNVTSAQLATADTTLKHLLKEGKSLTECDDSKSPTSPRRNRTPAKRDTNDRPDSPTDEDLHIEDDQSPSEVDKPSTRELEGAVNHRGHADGSESPTDGHLPTSKPKPLVGLQSQMSNLTVQSDDIQVIILSENNDAMAFYRLQGLVSYKLHLDQRSWELCFNEDGNIQRIPLSKIKDYKLNGQEKTFKLGVWAGNVKQNQEIKLSVSSSIESLINQLKDIGCYVEKKTDGSSHQKSAMKTRPVSCESNYGRSQGQNHMAHSQSYPDNLQNPYFRQFSGVQSPSSDHTEEPPYQTGNQRYQTRQFPFQSGNPQYQPQQPPCHQHLTGHPPVSNQQLPFHPQYQLGQPSSQAPISYINIGHVENFYHGSQSSPQTHQRPPYPQSQLTDSSREVNDGAELQQISESVASDYSRVAELLDMTRPSKIKLQESNNNYEEASYQLLHAWHQQEGSEATISRLAKVLYRARLYDAAKSLK